MKKIRKICISVFLILITICTLISCSLGNKGYDVSYYIDNTLVTTLKVEEGKEVELSIYKIYIEEKNSYMSEYISTIKGENQEFAGWYDSEQYNTKVESIKANSNVNLYGKFNTKPKNYKISLNENGGTIVSDLTVLENTVLEKDSLPTITKEGYTFDGWYLDAGCVAKFNSLTVKSNLTLYAKWNVNTYKVSFNTDGGNEIDEISVKYNESFELPQNPTKEGYKFGGWYTDKKLTKEYNQTKVTSNVTLYAKWEEILKYNVTFNTNGGTNVENIIVTENETVNLSAVATTRTGYTFVGWYTDAALQIPFNEETAINSNVVLHAKWTINKYKLTFDSNGGSAVTSVTVNYNSTVTLPDSPTKAGHIFLGWYTDKDCTVQYNNGKITADTTLYAKWETEEIKLKYKVSFETNGGTEIEDITVIENETVDLTKVVTERTGYTFVGWYTDSSLKTVFNKSTKINCNITLYAKWKNNQQTSSSGNQVTQNEIYYGVVYGLLDDELKEELHSLLLSTHTNKGSYKDAWTILSEADKGVGNTVRCIYTGINIPVSDRAGSSSASIQWNREHSWAKSHGFPSESYTSYSDCFHLFASEVGINSTRGNKDFGDFELLRRNYTGSDSYGNFWDGTYFEPRDEVKGDIARAMFYMAVRYDGCSSCRVDLELVKGSTSGSSNGYGYLGDLESLIKWHYEDPVSADEMARNEVVYGYQGNRNPFIDHPEFVYGLYSEYAQKYVS